MDFTSRYYFFIVYAELMILENSTKTIIHVKLQNSKQTSFIACIRASTQGAKTRDLIVLSTYTNLPSNLRINIY
jgi:hypothetical protein